jgi:hypothetical protein
MGNKTEQLIDTNELNAMYNETVPHNGTMGGWKQKFVFGIDFMFPSTIEKYLNQHQAPTKC